MTEFVKASGVTEAWLRAAEHIAEQPRQECVHMFLSIGEPTAVSTQDREVMRMVDQFLAEHGKQPLDTVADTIFPKSHYLKYGIKGVMDRYPASIQQLYDTDSEVRGHWPWGTYALRMLRYPVKNGKPINQLQIALGKLATSGKKSCFEVSTGPSWVDIAAPDNVAEIATYNTAKDARLVMGGPCLSHLSFTRDSVGGKLHLNATYRSHYYLERALGNLIGLSGLLAFMAHESGHECGTLAVNSTFAKLDAGSFGGKAAAANLIKKAKKVYDTSADPVELSDA